MKMRAWATIVMSMLLASACTGSDSGPVGDLDQTGNEGNAAEVGQIFQATISSSTGGIVATDSGAAQIEIPAGALVADMDITIAVDAKSADTETEIYQFGPDGLTFASPVTMSIEYGGAPPEGKSPVLAWLNGTAWEQISGSTVANGVVSAKVTHFSSFSVILVDDAAVVVSDCQDVAVGFQPCGGDVSGTWEIVDVCFDEVTVAVEEDIAPSCAEAVGTLDAKWGGSMTFTADEIDINFTSSSITVSGLVPNSCLEDTACSDVPTEALDEDWTCTSIGSMCQCVYSTLLEMPSEPEPYSIEGTSIVTGDAESPVTIPYCIEQEQVVMAVDMEAIDPEAFEGWPVLYWILQRI